MNVEKLLKLVEAGFTKDEIIKLVNSENAVPKFDVTNSEPTPETPKEGAKSEPAPEEPKEDIENKINVTIKEALKPFETLYNNMAKLAAMPSLESVEPKGIDDIIDSFFKGE